MFLFANPLHGSVLAKSKPSPCNICVEDLMLGSGRACVFKPTQAGDGGNNPMTQVLEFLTVLSQREGKEGQEQEEGRRR